MTKLVCLVLLCFCVYLFKSQNNIECESIFGNIANNGNNSTSICHLGYTLVSCGLNATETGSFGTIIDNNICIGMSSNSNGIQSVAQCCNSTNIQMTNDNCSTHVPNEINTNVECPMNTNMFGCSFHSSNDMKTFGSCTSNMMNDNCTTASDRHPVNYCVSSSSSETANARCCSSSVNIKCSTKWSKESELIANVSCDNNNFMSGCNGYHSNGLLTAWYIQNNNCIAMGKSSIYAIGICCEFIDTTTEEANSDTTALFIIIGSIFGLISIIILFFVLKTCCDAKNSFHEDSEAVSHNISNKNVVSPSHYDGVYGNNGDDNKNFTPGKEDPNNINDQNIIAFTPKGYNDFTENKTQINLTELQTGTIGGNILSTPNPDDIIGNNNIQFETPAGMDTLMMMNNDT